MTGPGGPSAPVVLTTGEPAGVGGELALMAWCDRAPRGLPPFCALDDPTRLAELARRIGLDVPVTPISGPAEAEAVFDSALPVVPHGPLAPVEPGRPDPSNAGAVIAAIDRAVDLAHRGAVSAIVTAPIHKATLYAGGWRAPGHTEHLARRAGPGARAVMMVASPKLRVVPVTVHVALREAVRALRTDEIVAVGAATATALQEDFGIQAPRIAVAGLNPHAGEGGAMGEEDDAIVAPAVEALRRRGIDATGPLAADSMFHARALLSYDAALCMYHDQALIPVKAIGFDEAVNVTLGLPFVRTSADHGTAFALAGSGTANPGSTIAAIALAGEIANRRWRAKTAATPARIA